MKYLEVNFEINAPEALLQDARDVLSAMAGEAGFETFEETDSGLKGYVQQELFSQPALDEILHDFPFEGVTVSYTVNEAEDRDWNEQWELEGFEPIVIRGERKEVRGERIEERGERKEVRGERIDLPTIVIHDGRHLPSEAELFSHHSPLTSHHSPLTSPLSPLPTPLYIEIDAHMAFGTGTHETTRMMLAALLDLQPSGLRVLDCGCGTGILGIAALKIGAAACTGYDIDQWSADNARHNAVINRVDQRFEALLGDASVLDGFHEEFDIVMANINRNILLSDMPSFRKAMKPEGTLLLSGFYESDVELLKAKAESLGLRWKQTRNDGEWCCLEFKG